MLNTGRLVSYTMLEDFLIRYEFSTDEIGDYTLIVRGVCGEARKVTASDFIRLLVAVCFTGATYQHDPIKEEMYLKRRKEEGERDTEQIRAVVESLNESMG